MKHMHESGSIKLFFLLPPLFSWSNRGSVYSHKVFYSPSRLIKLSGEAL